MSKRCWSFLAMGVIVVAVALGARIFLVNERAVTVDSRQYTFGEEMRLDGAFASASSESLEGYSLVVNGSTVMLASEYVDAYSAGDAEDLTVNEGAEVVVLDVMVSNDGNEEGYLNYKNWRLTPPQRNTAYYIDYDLWYAALPELSTGLGGFQVTPGTTVRLRIPFWHQDIGATLLSGGTENVQNLYGSISRGDYEFVVTNVPRYSVAFSLE